MGATGGTISAAIEHYMKNIPGPARKYIALHLIVTPEYLRKITTQHPDMSIYAIRIDRGLSSKRALDATPGTYWDEEKGLDNNSYIVPGAGGIGEIMNNSFD
jgi:uracil phosphoribosyltransferase